MLSLHIPGCVCQAVREPEFVSAVLADELISRTCPADPEDISVSLHHCTEIVRSHCFPCWVRPWTRAWDRAKAREARDKADGVRASSWDHGQSQS